MKRVAATLALSLFVFGCVVSSSSGSQVPPVTSSPEPKVPLITGNLVPDGCFAASATGLLVADEKYGTAIVDNKLKSMVPLTDVPVPVAWRPGFTARWRGSEVEVVDTSGKVVATTGNSYQIDGGYAITGESPGFDWPEKSVKVFWACDAVTPQ